MILSTLTQYFISRFGTDLNNLITAKNLDMALNSCQLFFLLF